MLGLAGVAVIEADLPLPREAAASSARWRRPLAALVAESPAGPVEGVPCGFRWSGGAPAPFRLVVLDAAYAELCCLDGVSSPCPAPPALAALLATGGTFHWYVETGALARPLRSALQTCEIR